MDYNDHSGNSRRAFLRLVTAGSAAATFGGLVGAQEDEVADDGTGIEDVPVAGDFPEGETVGLQQVADGLPAPTNLTYVDGGDEDRHFLATQTGQVYAFRPSDVEQVDGPGDDAVDTDADEPGNVTELGNDTMGTGDEPTDGEMNATGDQAYDAGEVDEFVLGGVTAAWMGREPPAIEGQENPTLRMVAGQTYTITWENVDGQPHNVVLLDEAGDLIERTEIMSEQGATQSLEFEATEDMDSYVCEVHQGTMDGDIEIVAAEEVADGVAREGVLTPDDMDLFLDVSDRLVDLGLGRLGNYDERGLLGLAFHPNFEEERTVYVRYSAPRDEAEIVDVPEDYDHVDVLAEYEVPEDAAGGEAADEGDVVGMDDDADVAGADDDAAGTGEAEVSLDSERRIMEIPSPQDNHNGGQLAFDGEGRLFTSVGDGGNVHDIGLGHVEDWYEENEGGNAQDTTENLLGGIHRIEVTPRGEAVAEPDDAADEDLGNETAADDVVNETIAEVQNETEDVGLGDEIADGDLEDDVEGDADDETTAGTEEPENGNYSIPEDNPLVGSEFRGEYYAWGFRNPWGMSIDDDGTMFVADAGQHHFESAYTVEEGGNYSWNVKEGSFCFSPASPLEPPEDCPDQVDEDVADPRGGEELRDPIVEYRHKRVNEAFIDSSVVVGGHRYAGDALEGLQDDFVFGNWSSEGVVQADGEVLVASEEDGAWSLTELQIANAPDERLNRYLYGVERDQDGELYLLANTDFRPFPETGEIYKIVPEEEGEEVPEPDEPATIDPEREADED